MTAALLAHQGGWDEMLLVLVPIAIFAALLAMANRRADAMGARGRANDAAADPPTDGPTGPPEQSTPGSGHPPGGGEPTP